MTGSSEVEASSIPEIGVASPSPSPVQEAPGSMHEKPPSSPQMFSSVLTQVHSQQSPPSYPVKFAYTAVW